MIRHHALALVIISFHVLALGAQPADLRPMDSDRTSYAKIPDHRAEKRVHQIRRASKRVADHYAILFYGDLFENPEVFKDYLKTHVEPIGGITITVVFDTIPAIEVVGKEKDVEKLFELPEVFSIEEDNDTKQTSI